MELQEARRTFIHSWGQLGSSWGINKVMGQIHALLLVSPDPLNTDEIMEALHISRGSANMNIRALIDWGIIYKEYVPESRKDYFVAEKDILALARQVSIERRKREVAPILKTLKKVQIVQEGKASDKEAVKEFKKVTGEINEFSQNIDKALQKFIMSDRNWLYRKLLKIFT